MDLTDMSASGVCAEERAASVGLLGEPAVRVLDDPAGHTRLDATVEDAFAEAVMPSGVLRPFDPAVKRWLAARLFGTWISYQGNGLMTIVRYLRTCLDIFDVELARDHKPLEAIRRADHSIVHEASSQQLANLLNVRP